MSVFLRLRQICLVARKLEPIVEDLRAIFDIEVCYRDPLVEQFGLHNVLLPVGNSFIEIVAPVRENTTAGRYLDRRRGDGGYMTIFDSDDLRRWRKHMKSVHVREAAFLEFAGFQGLQLHPRDTGGALLEINHSEGGENLTAMYHPAGPSWQDYTRTAVAQGIAGAELQGDDPERLSARWSQILLRPVQKVSDSEWRLAVDNASLRFVPIRDGRGEGLGGIDITVSDPASVKKSARERGLAIADNAVVVGGMRFNLNAHTQ